MNRSLALAALVAAVFAAAASTAQRSHARDGTLPRVRADLSRIAQSPRPIGSAAAAQARAEVARRLAEIGLEPRIERRFVCTALGACGAAVNVVARVSAAAEDEGPPIILAAHLDTVASSPGGHDDALGAAVLLEVARRLVEPERGGGARREVVLLFDDGEEVGLLGAQAFLEQHPEAATAGLFITVDGMAGPTVLRTKGPTDGRLLCALAAVPRAFVSQTERLGFAPGGFDDTDAFSALGVPSVTVAGQEGYTLYHTPRDTAGSVQDATIVDRAEATWALVQAGLRGDSERAGEHVYGEVFGAFLSLSSWSGLSAAAALLVAFAGWLLATRGGRGAVALAAALAAALGLRAALLMGFGPAGAPFTVLCGGGLLVGAAAWGPAGGGMTTAGLVAVAGVAGLAAVFEPALAFGPLVVAGAGAAGATLGALCALGLRAPLGLAPGLAAAVAGVVAADQLAAWHQLAPTLGGAPGVALALAPELLVLLALAPAAGALRLPRGWAVGIAGAAGLAFVFAPRPDVGRSGALRLVDEGPGRPARVAVFGATAAGYPAGLALARVAQLYPWSSGDYPVDVGETQVRAPRGPVVRTSTAAGTVRVRVQVPEGAAQLRVAVAPDTPASAIVVEGVELPMARAAVRWTHGWRLVTVHGPSPQVELTITPVTDRLRLDVGVLTPGLPEGLARVLSSRPKHIVPKNLGDSTEARAVVEVFFAH